MKVKVIKDHPGYGKFPTLKKGTPVKMGEEGTHYLNWYACEINGHETFIPISFVFDGKLTRDYNPTELIQKTGDILEVREIIYAWLVASNDNGEIGWIPAEVVVSMYGEL
jgi:hypothetical protein